MLKTMYAQDLKDPENILAISIENLKCIVNRINSITSMMGMKPKDTTKLKNFKLHKSQPKKNVLLPDGLCRCIDQLSEQQGNMETKKNGLLTLSRVGVHADQTKKQKRQGIAFCTTCKNGLDRTLVRQELMQIPEDTQVPPE